MFPAREPQDRHARMMFHSMQQIIHLDIRITAMRIMNLRPFPEERVRFIEKKNHILASGGAKDSAQILLRLANIFGDYLAQIDPIQIPIQLLRQQLRACQRAVQLLRHEKQTHTF
jgi:hypothetical protein